MYLFKNRPMMFGSFCSLLVLMICFSVPVAIRLATAVACFVVAGIVYFSRNRINEGFFGEYSASVYAVTLVMCGSMAFSCFGYGEFYVKKTQNALNDSNEELTVYLTDSNEGYLLLDGGKKIKCVIDCSTKLDEYYRYFTVYGTVKDISVYTENTSYYTAKGILAVCSGKHTATGQKVGGIFAYFAKMRDYATGCAEKFCGEQAGFISGLAFGDKNAIPDDVYAYFKLTGTSHICAVSGLHLVAVLAVVGALLKYLVPIGRVKHIVMILLTIAYVFLTGASLSVIRAGIMYLLFLLTFFTGQTPDSLTSLFFTAHIILLFEPYAYADIGLVLSLTATFGIVVFASPMIKTIRKYISEKDLPHFLDKLFFGIASSVAVSFCASLVVAVVLALYYGTVHPFSSLTTLLVSPSVTITLYLAPLFVMLSFLEPAAMFAGKICEASASLTVGIIRFCASTFDVSVSLNYFFTPFFFGAIIVMVGILIFKKASYGKYAVGLSVCFAAYLVTACVANVIYAGENYVIAKSTENGDIICVVSGRRAAIFDYGTGEDVTRLSDVTEMLGKKGITDIDSYVVARTNDNNANSVRYICSGFSVGKLYVPDVYGKDGNVTEKYEKYAQACGAELIKYFPSGEIEISDLDAKVSLCGTYKLDGSFLAPLCVQGDKKLIYVPYPSYSAVSSLKKISDSSTTVVYGSLVYEETPFVLLHGVEKMYITQYSKDSLVGNEYNSVIKSGCEEIIRGDCDIVKLQDE